MNIFLTIDVECYSGDYEREVYGRGMGHRAKGIAKTANTKDGRGLPYILRVLMESKARATFFVEALGATRWGLDPTKKICAEILEAGQEVQLHIHPSVALIEGFEDDTDVLHFQPVEKQVMLIEKGLEVLCECGVKNITSFRAGDFAADENTLAAMKRCGLKISSNRDLDVKCSTRSKLNSVFPVINDVAEKDGIIDLPLSCLRSPLSFLDGEYRHLELSAVSRKEMAWSIQALESAGYRSVCLLTHPGELYDMKTGGPIGENIKRLDWLCGGQAERMRFISEVERTGVRQDTKEIPRLPLHLSLGRLVEQIVKRMRGV